MLRAIDLVLGLALLLLAMPIIISAGLCIAIFDKTFPIFCQVRAGRNGKPFKIFKLKTMKGTSRGAVLQAHMEHGRITALGGFLRSTHIDELPQLMNVVLGSMSLVGPRPHEIQQDKEFHKKFPNYGKRYLTRPGISGIAQVNGYTGPVRTETDMELRIRCDQSWVENPSVYNYFIVLFRSVVFVLRALRRVRLINFFRVFR